jgi:hypothetical protein
MKITRNQLKQLIKEELTENTWQDTLDTVLHGSPNSPERKKKEALKQWKEIKEKLLAKIPQFAALTKSINGAFDELSSKEQGLLGPAPSMLSWDRKVWLETSGKFVTTEGKAYHLNCKQLLDLRNEILDDVRDMMSLELPIETGHAENELWNDIHTACKQAGCVDHMNGHDGPTRYSAFFDWARLTALPSQLDENTKTTTTILKDNNMKNREIRATVQELIKEIKQEKRQERVGSPLSESKQLSEVRTHVRKAINEMMVGLTPITRIDTQRDANNAGRGNTTSAGVDTTAIGFNTFDMHEWASIAGITENTGLSEHWQDDGYGSNVVDLRNPMSDESHEIPGMTSPEQPMPSAPCGGCDDGSCGCHREPGPMTGDVGHEDEVGNMDMDFERFLSGLEAQDDAGTTRIGAAAVEGDEYYEDEHGELDGEPEFSFTGDVGELDGDSAFAIGIEAGKRGLDDEEPRKPRG